MHRFPTSVAGPFPCGAGPALNESIRPGPPVSLRPLESAAAASHWCPAAVRKAHELGALSRLLLGIPVTETRFDRRGFQGGDARSRLRLESIGAAFLDGHHAALEEPGVTQLARALESVGSELRGFAYEGAAMGLTLLDAVTPWRRDRWAEFLAGPGEPHTYMLYVGAGWARARLPGDPNRVLERYDPLLRWLVIDGWGFHDGYFHWRRTLDDRQVPARLQGYARRAYDQGLGRALWFVNGAEVDRVAAKIAAFEPDRHGDLWSGIGLAAAYAGEPSDAALAAVREHSGEYHAWIAQGAAFAGQARRRAGNLAPHTERACRALCGLSAIAAADTTHEALRGVGDDGSAPAYEVWRRRVRERFQQEAIAV